VESSTDGERTRVQPPRSLVVAQPIPPPTTLRTPGGAMARGCRVTDGRALSPSSAIPGARLMPAMKLRHTRRHRNPSRCPATVYRLMQVAGPPPVGVTPAQPRDRPSTSGSTRQKNIAAIIICAEGYGVGFDTFSSFGWFGSTSLGALCTLHPPPWLCLHTSGSVTLAKATAGCCSHLQQPMFIGTQSMYPLLPVSTGSDINEKVPCRVSALTFSGPCSVEH
jgi:hypothetical protein